MHFEVRSTYFPYSGDPCDLIQSIEVDVVVAVDDEETDDEVIAARIGIDRFQFAGLSEVEIAEACDSRSKEWVDLWEALFLEEDIHPEIARDQELDEITYIHDAVIHPDLLPSRVAILSGILRMFQNRSLGVVSMTGRGLSDLSPSERLAIEGGRNLRPNLLIKTNGGPRLAVHGIDPMGMTAAIEARAWVDLRWKQGD